MDLRERFHEVMNFNAAAGCLLEGFLLLSGETERPGIADALRWQAEHRQMRHYDLGRGKLETASSALLKEHTLEQCLPVVGEPARTDIERRIGRCRYRDPKFGSE